MIDSMSFSEILEVARHSAESAKQYTRRIDAGELLTAHDSNVYTQHLIDFCQAAHAVLIMMNECVREAAETVIANQKPPHLNDQSTNLNSKP